MKLMRLLMFGALVGGLLWLAGGCSGVDQIDQPELEELSTLLVHYTSPGGSPDPCNDALPQVDGVGQDLEWGNAEPLFLRMTGDRGNGGGEFFLEVRAVWTDEGNVGGTDRIYFLIRYPDNELNASPDRLAYGTLNEDGEIVPSPAAIDTLPHNDPAIRDSTRWTRIHAGGVEDQVMLVLEETQSDQGSAGLVDADGALLGKVGFEVEEGASIPNARNTDVWVWRAGRTDLHPVFQYADTTRMDELINTPAASYSNFPQTCGFCEDLWVDGAGTLRRDGGTPPYAKNFGTNPVPIRLTQCPTTGRTSTMDEPVVINGGIPPDLGLWWFTAKPFTRKDVLACSRTGRVGPWSKGLLPGDYDFVQGWGLVFPTGSMGDVRAKGGFNVDQDKGFPVRTLEIMRDLDTGHPEDDLVIDPTDPNRHYRMVIGVFNASGRVGSGSTEIRLRFEKHSSQVGSVHRCG